MSSDVVDLLKIIYLLKYFKRSICDFFEEGR